jgi:MHS family proline/betaine transporter-like MFS transporter
MLWSSGFYLSFVWMAIFMEDLIESPVPHAFGVNSAALLISVCLFFPVAGILSDRYGRRFVMTIGGVSVGVLSPILVLVIGKGNALNALVAQSSLGVALSFWGAPMCAWLVEAFEPEARLTSVAIGYNLAQATVGGLTPSVATIMVDSVGVNSPGWILTVLSILSLTGLWIVAPPVGASPPASSTRKRTFQALPSTGECEMVVTQTSEDDTSDPGELI